MRRQEPHPIYHQEQTFCIFSSRVTPESVMCRVYVPVGQVNIFGVYQVFIRAFIYPPKKMGVYIYISILPVKHFVIWRILLIVRNILNRYIFGTDY